MNSGLVYFFFINGYIFALVWSKQEYFLFDSHSRSSEGFIAIGYFILMKFIYVDEVQNYIREVYLLQQIQYISIDVTESDINVIKSLKRKQINTDKHEIMKRKRKESYVAMTGIKNVRK